MSEGDKYPGRESESKFYAGTYREVPKYRILSLDGGGIYGLTEALLLKGLCDRDEKFLTGAGQPIALFAGCSAGAVNSLLLAKYDRPRDAIESGELERFWEEAGTFSNSDPLGSWLSYLGLTPWFSSRDFLDLLTRYFGDRTLGDLKQNVLVSTYAWSGDGFLPGVEQKYTHVPSWPWESWFPWLKDWPPPPQPTQALRDEYNAGRNPEFWVRCEDPDPTVVVSVRGGQAEGIQTDTYRHWQPQMIMSFKGGYPEGNPYSGARAVDVAYAAATPPGFRDIRHGLGDGGTFTGNPAPHAYTQLMRYLRWKSFNPDNVPQLLSLIPKHRKRRPDEDDEEEKIWNSSDMLLALKQLPLSAHSAIAVLSVGDGSRMPYLWPPNTSLGFTTFQQMASNPWRGVFFPPTAYAIQAAAEEADGLMKELLGWHYCRLNPPVMELPTLTAASLCRFPIFQQQLIQTIRQRMSSRVTQDALDMTASKIFLKHEYVWAKNEIWLPLPLGPCPELEEQLEALIKENWHKITEDSADAPKGEWDEAIEDADPLCRFGKAKAPVPWAMGGKIDPEPEDEAPQAGKKRKTRRSRKPPRRSGG